MNIQITTLAEQKLREALGDQPGYFRLTYDTEDCGCNGISVILITSEPGHGDIEIDAGSLPFIIHTDHMIFYEESLLLDVEPNFPSFKLYSNSTIYNTNLKTRDMRVNDTITK